jgi:hypothetical protein
VSSTISVSALFKDLYPEPGTRIKQWVVELQREQAWERETCPRIESPPHRDNTDLDCRNVPTATWLDLAHHDCCWDCNDFAERLADRPDIAEWRALRAARPPITSDREALSDEIAPNLELRDHPIFAAMRRR